MISFHMPTSRLKILRYNVCFHVRNSLHYVYISMYFQYSISINIVEPLFFPKKPDLNESNKHDGIFPCLFWGKFAYAVKFQPSSVQFLVTFHDTIGWVHKDPY